MRIQMYLNQHPGQISLVLAVLIGASWLLGGLHVDRAALVIMYLAGILGTVPILLRAWGALRMKTISIELLVTIACIGALIIGAPDEAAIVTLLFLFGSVLEARTLAKTRSAVRSLTNMAPAQADVINADGNVEPTDIDDIAVGMNVLVRPGDQVPVDGRVMVGTGRATEAVITGEAAPVIKHVGDAVYAGSMLDSGALTVTTTAAGDDSTFGQIIALVEDAQDAQAPVARFIDRFARYYTPAVLVIALVVGLLTQNVRLAITMLVLGCPGALVIGAPVANVAGIGRAASQGVLFKGGATADALAGVDTLMLDKTGTITTGKMSLSHVVDFTHDEAQDLALLAAIESGSKHPLAQAITRAATARVLVLPTAPVMRTVKGQGLASDDGHYLVGNERLLASHDVNITAMVRTAINGIQADGDSVVIMAVGGQVRLVVGVNDVVRDDAAVGLNALKRRGIKHIVMLTGDNQAAADRIAAGLPIDAVQAELLPAAKLAAVRSAQVNGHKVAFVGDGINDAPALATADVGIGMGGGTAVALETADVVLVKPDFTTLTTAVHLARATRAVTRQNIVIAVGTVVLLLLGLVAGIIQMASGMFVHEASILIVIFNALRLLRQGRTLAKTKGAQEASNLM